MKVDRRALAVSYAWAFVGRWYKWGGDDPSGFDCSGFVIEALMAIGVLPRGFDGTADDLFRRFEWALVATPAVGCLAFWLNPQGKAVHVELCIDELHCIGASGGGSATTTVEAAIRDNAFIKIRPMGSRPGRILVVDPFKTRG